MILAFDPGKITGVAIGDKEGTLHSIHQYNIDQLYVFLFGLDQADTFIIENFAIRPDKAQSFIWSNMEVIQIIGALKFAAYELEAEVIMQEPTIKPVGYRWAGIVPPKNHNLSHEADAYAHLVFHWVKRLNLQPPSLKRIQNEETTNAKGPGAIGRSLGHRTAEASTD